MLFSLEEMEDFSELHCINKPKKYFLQPTKNYEQKLYNWRAMISNLLELSTTLQKLYENNMQFADAFCKVAEYVGINIYEHTTYPKIGSCSIVELRSDIEDQLHINHILFCLCSFILKGANKKLASMDMNAKLANYNSVNDFIVYLKALDQSLNKNILIPQAQSQKSYWIVSASAKFTDEYNKNILNVLELIKGGPYV